MVKIYYNLGNLKVSPQFMKFSKNLVCHLKEWNMSIHMFRISDLVNSI